MISFGPIPSRRLCMSLGINNIIHFAGEYKGKLNIETMVVKRINASYTGNIYENINNT